MGWIESHTVLMRHRKVADLARSLRIRRSYALGHLHALWHAAMEQREDGDLSSWTDEFIAEQADFPGDAPQFVRLLQENGLFDGKMIHDWIDYAGTYLTKKYHTSNRERLVEIWAKHGRTYGGKKKGSNQEADSKQTGSLPNPPNPHTEPTQPEVVPSDGEGHQVVNSIIAEFLFDQAGPKDRNAIEKMLKAVGEQKTRELLREAVDSEAGRPALYALGTLTNRQIKAKASEKPKAKAGVW